MSRFLRLFAAVAVAAATAGVLSLPAAARIPAPPLKQIKVPPSHRLSSHRSKSHHRHHRRRSGTAFRAAASSSPIPFHGEQWVDCDNDYGYDELWATHPAVGVLPSAPYGTQQTVGWEPVYFRLVGGVWTYAGEGPWSFTTANSVYTRRYTDASGNVLGMYAPRATVPAGNRWRVAARIYWYPTGTVPSSSYYGWIDSYHTMWSFHRMIDMGMNDINTWGSSCYLP